MYIYDEKFVSDTLNVRTLSERNPDIAYAADLAVDRRKQLEDNAKITSLGRIKGTERTGNAKHIAWLPPQVALWILREAPHIIVDDKCWELFLKANPEYKL